MDSLENMFNANAVACANDGIRKILCSGPKCLGYFLQFCGAYREEGSETRIEEVYKHLGWVQNRSLTLLDVQIVLETLKGTLFHSIKHVKIRRKTGEILEDRAFN